MRYDALARVNELLVDKTRGGDSRLSPGRYVLCVGAATLVLLACAALLRRNLAFSVEERLGLRERPRASAGSFYSVRVAPVLEAHCMGCHGPQRQKAHLRLDDLAGTLAGGKHGPVVYPGRVVQSELISRVTLPQTDARAMPPDGKAPLSRDEVKVIVLWVAAGASGGVPTNAIKGAPLPKREISFPVLDERAVERARAPIEADVRATQKRFPSVVAYIARDSADLDINAALLGQAFADKDLAALLPLHDYIVRLDLSHTDISDSSAQLLASMSQLRVLRLVNTQITDVTLEALARLTNLRLLAIGGTQATSEAIHALQVRGVSVYNETELQTPAGGATKQRY